MKLNDDNYYSAEANKEYWSVSLYKSFCKCESNALATLNGEEEQKKSDALLLGSYCDSYFEGTLDKFKEDHPELFKKDGTLYAKYEIADKMIAKATAEPKFMQYMSGEKQRIFTAELFGQKWKCKLDSYLPGVAIVDLKTISKISEIANWGYHIQAAVYQEIVYLNTGMRLPFYLACVSKEEEPELAIIQIPQSLMDETLTEVAENMERFAKVKSGEIEPERCESCSYCKKTKELKVVSYFDYY